MEEKSPLVSILIPTTGRLHLIREAIASVLAQDMQDFEIVIADLGDEKKMQALIQEVEDKRIQHIPVPRGTPGLSTWDIAARHAQGEYFFWLDDDNALLPGALSLLMHIATESRADFIAGGHVYYYDHAHPRTHLRGALGVVPFTGKCRLFSAREAIEALFTLARVGPKHRIPRLHPSALLVSREVVQKAQEHFGSVLFTDLPNTHSFQPILLSQAKRCLSVDYPIVVVGRLGLSMSQVWSTAARERFRKVPFVPAFSPVSGYTRINGTMENYLRLQKQFPDDFGNVPVNLFTFANIYLQELRYLDMDLSLVIPVWRNFFGFISSLPERERNTLFTKALRYAACYPFVFFSRRLTLHTLWRTFTAPLHHSSQTSREAFAKKREFSILLVKYPNTSSIGEVAENAFEIIKKEIAPDSVPILNLTVEPQG